MSGLALVLSFALAAFAAAETHAQDRQASNREIYLHQGADRGGLSSSRPPEFLY